MTSIQRMELEFVAFLSDLGGRVEPIELIINGDFLEFVQAEPWADADLSGKSQNGLLLCFTEAQSLAKLMDRYWLENIFCS